MKEKIEKLLARKKEISAQLADEKRSFDDKELGDLETELRDINEQVEALEKRQRLMSEAKEINDGSGEQRTITTFNDNEDEKRSIENDIEKRNEEDGKALLEKRAITVSSGDLVLPKHTSSTINATFNQVSTLIDGVKHTPLIGGESYQQPYEISHGEGGSTAEGTDYSDVETKTDYADIKKSKITAYEEITEEVEKLPSARYANLVKDNINKSLRRKITRQILVGTGATNELVGIFSANATAIKADTDKEIATIDASTLDDIVFSYGGPEDVEDLAVLILNKDDLKSFAMLRDDKGQKVYEVKPKGNVGTINNVPYIINSACKNLKNGQAGDYLMAYGPLSNYELTTFSETDMQRSADYKFKQGIIAHRGSVFVGGNVVANNGFLRVKKAAGV
ncbi:phage major capsid protein [Lysinibacillus fusiformis]|uniref:Phage major capsid protein, HK97 family n=1 Tax=Lysinibacillus fusiformis TaxID=28031 RepID=A0A1H9HC09_9BACI|nr:phage major capsid protein [Lysinibacillus fusiformis]SCY30509.1 phage major capsid protein, HK97 family [Lysinibacillus fusiformis]SEN53150.1 phage major capsid protein, HK97 family [Lysinibacillus fusiformis]SEQ59833.1 phage major capsid protein, HK97 family [Lysinibacillus fusiformis]